MVFDVTPSERPNEPAISGEEVLGSSRDCDTDTMAMALGRKPVTIF
jgi:hypothetical protein